MHTQVKKKQNFIFNYYLTIIIIIFRTWNTGTGPISDLYNISENPQFFLDVGTVNSGAVWILLTRHITELQDFKENREYITVIVYRNNGKRVHYPSTKI